MSELIESLRKRFGALTSADVAALDRAAGDAGVTVVQLMEVAGWQVARCAWRMLGARPGHVLVLAGRGNNGGDGLVAARHLATWGCRTEACVTSEESQLDELLTNHVRSARAAGAHVEFSTETALIADAARQTDLVLDGLLGTGLGAAPREPQASIIRTLSASRTRLLAIDVPSGLDATTGEAFDPTITAAATCTLVAAKAGFWTDAPRQHTGDLWVADIGMPTGAWKACGLAMPTDVRGGALVPVPSPTSH